MPGNSELRTVNCFLLPEFFPIPHFGCDGAGERVAELVGEHRGLSAVVGFVGKHLAEHTGRQLGACGPGPGPSIAHEVGDARRAIPFSAFSFFNV